MSTLGLSDEEWVTDARILLGTFNSADIWIPKWQFLIMIDGEGHFTAMHDTISTQQAAIDDRFNAESLSRGFSVLRLHYLDLGIFEKVIHVVARQCKSATSPCLLFSKHYRLSEPI